MVLNFTPPQCELENSVKIHSRDYSMN